MTVATMETNLDGVQEAEKAIRLVDKGQKKKRFLQMSNEQVKIFVYLQITKKKIGENSLILV
jgi:hypothetical protein